MLIRSSRLIVTGRRRADVVKRGDTVKHVAAIAQQPAVAREVVDDRLNPSEPIAVTDRERFCLPLRDGTAHPAALEALGR